MNLKKLQNESTWLAEFSNSNFFLNVKNTPQKINVKKPNSKHSVADDELEDVLKFGKKFDEKKFAN